MIHPLEKKLQHLRGICKSGFLFQQFSLSLFGETAISKDFQLMWSSQQTRHSSEAAVFDTPFQPLPPYLQN